MSSPPRPPTGAHQAGRRLWRAVLDDFELAEHELVLLREAVAVVDVCHELQAVVATHGPMVDGKANPALVELRMQRQLLGRLLAALRVPLGAEEDQPAGRLQRRTTRGFYGVRAVS